MVAQLGAHWCCLLFSWELIGDLNFPALTMRMAFVILRSFHEHESWTVRASAGRVVGTPRGPGACSSGRVTEAHVSS
jgi:hypothetical protein